MLTGDTNSQPPTPAMVIYTKETDGDSPVIELYNDG